MEILNNNVVGFDCKGKEVFNDDYMVLDQGDIAYFYKIENGIPKVIANWMIGSLGLIDYENQHEEMMKSDAPIIVKKQQEVFYKEIVEVNIIDLEKVSHKMKYYLELIQNNGEGHMPLTGSLENPNEDFDDGE